MNNTCVSKEAYFEAEDGPSPAMLARPPYVSGEEGLAAGRGVVALSFLSAVLLVGFLRRRKPQKQGDNYVNMTDAEQ